MASVLRSTTQLARIGIVRSSLVGPSSAFFRFAGHSKWQNIRHIKAANDSIKSVVARQIVNKLKLAVKEGGSTDPRLNKKVAQVMEEAKHKKVPNSTLSEALKRLEKRTKSQQLYFEGKGPGNCAIILEVWTDKGKNTWNDIQSHFKRLKCSLSDKKGSSSFAFDTKGILTVPKTGDLTFERAEEVAIIAESEEVQEGEYEGEPVFQFICGENDMFTVKKQLEQQTMDIIHFEKMFIPTKEVQLNPEQLQTLDKLYERLTQFEEIENIFDNVSKSDDS